MSVGKLFLETAALCTVQLARSAGDVSTAILEPCEEVKLKGECGTGFGSKTTPGCNRSNEDCEPNHAVQPEKPILATSAQAQAQG